MPHRLVHNEQRRLTQKAGKALVFAGQETKRLGTSHVSSEHLLVGLLQEENCTAVAMLNRLGTTRQAVLAALAPKMKHSSEALSSPDLQGSTEDFKRAIDMSFEEAHDLSHDVIGTQHLLLGILRGNEGSTSQILRDLGLGLEPMREAVMQAQKTDEEVDDASPKRNCYSLSSVPEEYVDDNLIDGIIRSIIRLAIREGASEVLIEPKRRSLHTRFRINGVLNELMTVPHRFQAQIINRLKTTAGLTAEERVQQSGRFFFDYEDGRISINHECKDYVLEMTFVPTKYGETISAKVNSNN